MNIFKEKRGFTLIELLVVVAIIGLLASVIMISLTDARNRGADAAVKTNLHTVANQAELFSSDNGNSYLPSGGVPITDGTCPTYDESGTSMFSKDKAMNDAIVEATKNGKDSFCYNSSNTWSVAVGLKVTSGTSWCVDNSGAGKIVNSIPSGAINSSGYCN